MAKKLLIHAYRLHILLCVLFFGVHFKISAQQSVPEFKDWISFIEKSESKKLGASFSDMVAIELLSQKGNFNKTQAVMMLADFFQNNPADSVRIRQQGTAGANTSYFIGDYYSKSFTYYIYVVANKEKEKYYMHIFNIKRK